MKQKPLGLNKEELLILSRAMEYFRFSANGGSLISEQRDKFYRDIIKKLDEAIEREYEQD